MTRRYLKQRVQGPRCDDDGRWISIAASDSRVKKNISNISNLELE
ncbi:hypothetical protein [Saliniramus fredricksonii]|nr:hypothetical protein [Saliniramus fredricksonii]